MALRLSGDAETGFWGLLRGGMAAGGALGRLAGALFERVRPPPTTPEEPRPQLSLWVVDGEGLPPRPWRLAPDARFDCIALRCRGMRASVCVARQKGSDAQRTQQASRGQGVHHVTCQTALCAQGRGIREALDPAADTAWRGSGFGRRYTPERGPKEQARQLAAAHAKARVGLLDPVSSIDGPAEWDGEFGIRCPACGGTAPGAGGEGHKPNCRLAVQRLEEEEG